MDKFSRKYKLSIETTDGKTLTIEPPLTLSFSVDRSILSSANNAVFRIMNLSERTRNRIRKNRLDFADLRSISVRAGYGDNLPVIFSGNVSECASTREGQTFVTQIECFDAGYAFANTIISMEFPAGTSERTIIETIIRSLPGVSVGTIGSFDNQITRGNSYSGSAIDILREISGGTFYVDNGRAYVLRDNEVVLGSIAEISSASGLLGTPVLQETFLTFDILFEPRLFVGQKVRLNSITAANFNGEYKVVSVKHSGTISEAIGDDARTSVALWAPPGRLTLVN